MLNTPYTPWPKFTQEEAQAVANNILSNKVNYWTGNECKFFEQEFAAWVGVPYAVAVMNGTVALDLALKALNIGVGDEVIVTARSFIASVSCIVLAGATPVFADVDENSQNITAKSISQVLSPRTKAIICVHLAGWPCDMDPIMDLAREQNIFVIEDCAQAHGARYKGRSVGSIGHIGAWSFCQDKIMTTGGEGGMVTTANAALWERMWSYKDHGKSISTLQPRSMVTDFQWVHHTFGTNWRMLEMQAVIGRLQLQNMDFWNTERLANAKRIWQAASRLKGLRVPMLPESIVHAAYKCYVFVEESELQIGWNRAKILQEICKRNVPCYLGSSPEMYLEKAFDNTPFRPQERLPVAKRLGETSLMFLVHPTLTAYEIDKTIDVLLEVFALATTKSYDQILFASDELVFV